MFLEEQVRDLEERLKYLEAAFTQPGQDVLDRMAHRLESLEKRLEGWGRFDQEFRTLSTRLDGLNTHSLGERIDECESTCHELINAEEALRKRAEKSETRVAGLGNQVENLLEQLAELDSKRSHVDLSPIQDRMDRLEREWQQNQGWKGSLQAFGDQVRELEAKLIRRLDESSARVDRLQENVRESAARIVELDRHTLPARTSRLEERVEALNPAAHFSQWETRTSSLERGSQEMQRELTWLRDRPAGDSSDGRARLFGIGGLALAMAAIALALWPYSTITARKFVVADAQRRPIAEWGSNIDGATLELRSRAGEPRILLSATEAGSLMAMRDNDKAERIRLSSSQEEGSGMMVYDQGGHRRLWQGIAGSPALLLFDEMENVRSSMALEATGPEIGLFEVGQKPRVRIITGQGDNGLRVYDDQGIVRLGLGMSDEGPALNLFDSNLQRRVVLSSTLKGTALTFLGDTSARRTTVGMTEKDESILKLADGEGKDRVVLFATAADAAMQVLDRETNVQFTSDR